MFAIENRVCGAKDQPRARISTQFGKSACELDINRASKLRVCLAKINIRQGRGVDDRIRLHVEEQFGQLSRRQRITNMPKSLFLPHRFRTSGDSMYLPLVAGLGQHTARYESV